MKKCEVNIAKLLTFLQQYIGKNGYPPTYREIQAHLNIRSINTIKYYIDKLEERELIRRDPNKKRTLELTDSNAGRWKKNADLVKLPLLGHIAGGLPILAEENMEANYCISKEFFGTEQDLFMLKVVGESMRDAGIADKDTIVAKVQNTAEDGDIVVARTESGTTVKKFYREKNGYRLQPQNSSHFPIFVPSVEILGKVIAVIKLF